MLSCGSTQTDFLPYPYDDATVTANQVRGGHCRRARQRDRKPVGNEDQHRYVSWFLQFAHEFHRLLKDDGSLVIEIGGAWKAGTPTRSLYHYELLIALCKDVGFHLAQEFYWYNPAKLPSPAEWVNVRKIRVKDAVNCLWWLSKTPWPKANNQNILREYSPDMHRMLKRGYRIKKGSSD